MQPGYASSDFEQNQQQRQYPILSKPSNNSSNFPISSPHNLNHPYHPHPPLYFQHRQHRQPQHVFIQHQQHQFLQHQQEFRPPFHYQQQEQEAEERLHRQIWQQHQEQHGAAPPQPSVFTVDFKLGLNGNNVSKKVGPLMNQEANEVAPFIHGNEENPPQHGLLMSHCWHPQEDSDTIKEPFWKQLNRCNNKQRNENGGQEIQGKMNSQYKPLHTQEVGESGTGRYKNVEGKCMVFSELEAIYSLATIGERNQAGSGSALTGDNSPTNAGLSMPFGALHGQNVGTTGAVNRAIGVDNGSENSVEEEASLRKSQKRKMKEELASVCGFIENVVKQVMDYQEMLHRSFLEVIERMDKERTEREETWRRREAAKYNREAIARAHEQALASSREAQIVSYIENITGQSINLPARMTPLLMQPGIPNEPINEFTPMRSDDNHSRWPKAEVEALIQVRSSIETKFQEPGVKGPLWEQVSSLMSSMGYQRSAKRCKEKWENINKYFRKAKEKTKRSLQSKTCSYFHQLDQLYSRANVNRPPYSSTTMPSYSHEVGKGKEGYSGLVEAFTVERGPPASTTNPSSEHMKIAELGSSRLDLDGVIDDRLGIQEESQRQGKERHGEEHRDGGDVADAHLTM